MKKYCIHCLLAYGCLLTLNVFQCFHYGVFSKYEESTLENGITSLMFELMHELFMEVGWMEVNGGHSRGRYKEYGHEQEVCEH